MYGWKSKINGPALQKWLLYCIDTINKYVLLRIAKMKMDSNVKTFGRFFSSFCSCGKTLILAFSFFQNSCYFISSVVLKGVKIENFILTDS